MDFVREAERFAVTAHEGQVDKAGQPYIDHPRRVAARVAETDGRPEAVAVALLHDVVEDAGVTLNDLSAAGFSAEVVAGVDAMTRRPGEGDDYYRRVGADELAIVAKRADIWDNTNPERLARLPLNDQVRLKAKYIHALQLLGEACEGTSQ